MQAACRHTDMVGRARGNAGRDEIHARGADKTRHEFVGGVVVEIERLADLLDPAIAQNHDLVGHGHGFDLIMGDIDHRGFEVFVQLRQLDPHLHAQFGIEIGQRFVEQKDFRIAGNRPSDRYALALPARQLPGLALQQLVDLQQGCGCLHALRDLVFRHPHIFKPEGQIVIDAHMRIERIALKHHRQPARGRRVVGDILAVNGNRAAGRRFQSGDHPQQRRFAATRRADKHHEFAIGNIEINAVQNLELAEGFRDGVERQAGHADLTFWPEASGPVAPSPWIARSATIRTP